MPQLVALEYRQQDWQTAPRLAQRMAHVADACARRGLGAVGVAGLLAGRPRPLEGFEQPAVLFGLRARSPAAVVRVAEVMARRGFSCVWGRTDDSEGWPPEMDRQILAGHGLVEAKGADRCLVGASSGQIRRAFEQDRAETRAGVDIWMPAPDRFGRAVDGVILEEARRHGVPMLWVQGDGLNELDDQSGQPPVVVRARQDTGSHGADRLARWAAGSRMERGKMRLDDLRTRPGRWLREIAGLR